ncbi:pyridoxal phosphate-dependent aminotransferase [Gemmobacter nectariphilus]|uniref:pyridoxal phosphate-dependent aminotransferase n=1 Tax=Gemmobacter nectariphilus TaxID=220343 RepID=UPI000487ECDE|nr:histidinol-phosphate transaminase [Gemmobacter nectariphilus]
MSRFWSPLVRSLVPYVPGEQPKDRQFIKLNTNENPHGPSPRAIEAIRAATGDGLRLYPDPVAGDLRAAVAESFGLTPAHVFAGNGSDEVLAHAFNAFFGGGGEVLFADVTYSFYPTYCTLYGLPHRLIPLDADFGCDVGLYRGPCAGIVIANPNAPTGIPLGLAAIESVLRANPDVVVIVDEAYVDFGCESAAGLIAAHDNLLVVQTFSKSRSMAGLRVGLALGQPHLIEGLVRVKDSFNSYPLGRLALAGALAAWQDRDWFDRTRAQVMADREAMAEGLRAQGFTVLPSAANFVFAHHPGMAAEAILAGLRERGILVRHFRQERICDWLRISVGTSAECAALLAATGAILAGGAVG